MAANCAAIKELDNPSLLESMEFSHEEVSPLPPASPSQRDGSKSPSPPLARRSQNKEPKRRLSPPPYSADLGKGNKLRTAEDVINRIVWDEQFNIENYVVGYLDRFNGDQEIPLSAWKKDITDEEFIPLHRILYIMRSRGDGETGEIVWDRRKRIDKIFNSGNSAYKELSWFH